MNKKMQKVEFKMYNKEQYLLILWTDNSKGIPKY